MLKKFAKMGFKYWCIYIFFVFVIFCTLKICSQQTKPSIISAKCNVKVIAKKPLITVYDICIYALEFLMSCLTLEP